MSEDIQIGDKVALKSFHGTLKTPPGVEESEGYWKLIGMSGVVMDKKSSHPAFPQFGARVLVKFDSNPKDCGLHCHNSIEGSLWVFIFDVVRVL